VRYIGVIVIGETITIIIQTITSRLHLLVVWRSQRINPRCTFIPITRNTKLERFLYAFAYTLLLGAKSGLESEIRVKFVYEEIAVIVHTITELRSAEVRVSFKGRAILTIRIAIPVAV
tara:strand:- start:70 stop:423 length:354 start_codon:yes stop_codon:yes gene_type:complete